ncbi:HNH endonuclease [Bacillus infantis]|uniref:HNH endonuclease n=1 Tax=Bacillus infantis TaxID=324767 RepID=UPI00209CF214|nr:HNH endonuclease [Bacillus infantis]
MCNLITKKERKLKVPYEKTHKFNEGIEYKMCASCDEWHPMNEDWFYKNKSSPDGFHPYCKEKAKEKAWNNYKDDPTGEKKSKKAENMKDYAHTYNGLIKRRKAVENWRAKGGSKEYYSKNKNELIKYNTEHYKRKKHNFSNKEWENCKKYFQYQCAYCGMSEEFHKEIHKQQLHKEHVIHDGSNDLSNCVPSCKNCNSQKHDIDFDYWYVNRCPKYSEERYNKIMKWINSDYKLYIRDNKKQITV